MIPAAEVQRRAREWQVAPMVVELDYVLGCFVNSWFRQPVADRTLFKGGTCLRKCYFADYRFSEDIDITAEEDLDLGQVSQALEAAAREVGSAVGVDMFARPPRIEMAEIDAASRYIEARLYFRGPLQRTGWPQGMRVDISTGETLAFAGVRRRLIHPYSDEMEIGAREVEIPCYDLREVLLEKLRALSGQRRYPISRDLYDVHELMSRAALDLEDVIPQARTKFAAKGVELSPQVLQGLLARKEELENDWTRNLERLVPGNRPGQFREAWETAVRLVSAIVEAAEGGVT